MTASESFSVFGADLKSFGIFLGEIEVVLLLAFISCLTLSKFLVLSTFGVRDFSSGSL